MDDILPSFKVVRVIFARLAVVTGAHALFNPVRFAASFGIPLHPLPKKNDVNINPTRPGGETTASYVSLMGVRQLAAGVALLAFASQGKWIEMATILVVHLLLTGNFQSLSLVPVGRSRFEPQETLAPPYKPLDLRSSGH